MDFLQVLAFDEQNFRRQLSGCSLSELEEVEKLTREQLADIPWSFIVAGREPSFIETINFRSQMELVTKK